jgi:thiamine biosynthesis lipoprotein
MMPSAGSPRKPRPETARKPLETHFDAIGTRWNIQTLEPVESKQWSLLISTLLERIETFDKAYSRFREDSWVAEIARAPGRHVLPADAYTLLRFYDRLYEATAGKVTPLIGQVMADTGYDAAYSFAPRSPRRPPRWKDVLSYGRNQLTASRPVLLDFGAAGKGYLVDIIGELIEQAGISSYLIDAGGDILHRSKDGGLVEVGLENPLNTTEAIGIARLKNQSLCASAGSKRQWGDFHHILDPESLRSPRHVLASWVMASDTMTADGVATALFFTGPSELLKHFSFSYVILYEGMKLQHSPDFPVKIFTANENYESDR